VSAGVIVDFVQFGHERLSLEIIAGRDPTRLCENM
jgi:hypothetical protein